MKINQIFKNKRTAKLLLASSCLILVVSGYFSKEVSSSKEVASSKIQQEKVKPSITKVTAKNLQKIEKLLTKIEQNVDPSDILVVFDFNYTLMYPSEPCLHIKNIKRYEKYFKKIINQLSSSEIDQMLATLMGNKPQDLVSDDFPAFFKEYDVNFVVCSSSLASNAAKYVELLKDKGIEITNTYDFDNFEFKNFEKYAKGYPIYDRGVIAANRVEKGEVLQSLINRLKRKPKVLIFIDNNSEKLQSVESIMKNNPTIKGYIVEYTEYQRKFSQKVSKEEFEEYWGNKVKEFKKSS